MNRFALLPIFLLLVCTTKAQDRIISTNHDTILCKIVSINNEHIRYELTNKDGSVTGKFMNLSQVMEYTRSVRQEKNSKPGKPKLSKPVSTSENKWRLGLSIGGSTMPRYFDNASDAISDSYKKLKNGFHINAGAHYMLNNSWGIGAEYSFFNSSFSGDMQTQYSPTEFITISEKTRQYINYLGPSVLLVQDLDARRKFTLNESLSVGALFIRLEDQNTFPNVDNSGYTDVTNNSLLTGISLASKLGISAEYRLCRKVSVGIGGDFIWCSLKKANYEEKGPNNSSSVNNQELTNAMHLSRIDYSIVLRYHF